MNFKSINKKNRKTFHNIIKIRPQNTNKSNIIRSQSRTIPSVFDNQKDFVYSNQLFRVTRSHSSTSTENELSEKAIPYIMSDEELIEIRGKEDFRIHGFTQEPSVDFIRDFSKKFSKEFSKEHQGEDEEEDSGENVATMNVGIQISNLFKMQAKRNNPTLNYLSKASRRFSSYDDSVSNDETVAKPIAKGLSSKVFILNYNRNILNKVIFLRDRENINRAGNRLAKEIPPYPDWVYLNEDIKHQDIFKINVGGRIFHLYENTIKNLFHTKLAICVRKYQKEGIPFFDRDPKCFNSILNFYRTGRLHVPPNTCLSLFEEELEFWGISEMFIEPCCWSDFNTFKIASITLKKFVEDMDKTKTFQGEKKTPLMKWRMNFYMILTKGYGSVLARWMSALCALFIFLSIFGMLLGTTSLGRVEVSTGKVIEIEENETVSHFFYNTKLTRSLEVSDFIISGFFLGELLARFILCPKRLEFFSDTHNWVDLFATMTSLLSLTIRKKTNEMSVEGYVLILKLPRILRLFRLTAKLRTGMEAFILTLKASAKELKLVFLMLYITASIFGALIFVVEMINEDEMNPSAIKSAFTGVWFAVVTMSTVGYGDIHPKSLCGYLFTSCCILCGVIICQLPVPIVLQNFRVYHNQATARLTHKTKLLVHCLDPESITDQNMRSDIRKMKGRKKFSRLFKNLH